MRKCVMEFLQRNQMLKKTCFNIDDHQLAAFVWTHCQDGAWTDSALVIQSATAMFLGRNINIVGTSNTSSRGYTTVYDMGEADIKSLLCMGYYQKYPLQLQLRSHLQLQLSLRTDAMAFSVPTSNTHSQHPS